MDGSKHVFNKAKWCLKPPCNLKQRGAQIASLINLIDQPPSLGGGGGGGMQVITRAGGPMMAPGATPTLRARMRPAPAERASLVLATHHGDDPRTRPEPKGPDLDAMIRLRTQAQEVGADEAVVLVDGQLVEGSTSALLWWNGDTLVVVPEWMPRVASVTERSIRVLATALGTEVVEYLATPDELDHKEIWAVNALHGIRLVTAWHDGPSPAAEPGRRDLWQRRLDALRSSGS